MRPELGLRRYDDRTTSRQDLKDGDQVHCPRCGGELEAVFQGSSSRTTVSLLFDARLSCRDFGFSFVLGILRQRKVPNILNGVREGTKFLLGSKRFRAAILPLLDGVK